MIRSKKFTTVGIAAASLGLAVSGVAFAGSATAATKPQVIQCDGKGQVKPKEIVLACGDAGIMVQDITWKKWNSNKATGTGTLRWNTCLPETCVAGIVQTYKTKITLGGIASVPGETDVFSQMTLTFTQGGPASADQAVYDLDNSRR
jgi:hypothetical protein